MSVKNNYGTSYRYIVAIIYAVVLFLDRLDLTIVNIILPALASDFQVPIVKTEWVNNAYLLALAISIPISGWLGERFGLKKVFIMATAVFGLFSFCCAFAPNIEWMAVLRFIQGLGGGVIIPVGMTLVYQAPFDWIGFLLVSCALICVLFFISSLGRNESYFQVIGILALAVGSIFLFFKQEKRQKHPLIDLKFFKNALFLQSWIQCRL